VPFKNFFKERKKDLSFSGELVLDPLVKFDVPVEVRKEKKLSVLLPFLNEEKHIVHNVYATINILNELDFSYEIILIDDGSTDNSYEILKKEFGQNNSVKIVKNYSNFGKGWALKTGFEFSTGDFILFLDSDLELSPYHIPGFFRIMLEENADAVIGSKLHKFSVLNYPFYRRLMSLSYYLIVKILFGLPVMDTQTGIKLFKREALEISLPKVLVKRFAFDIELLLILYKNKKKISSAPVKLDYSRKFGWNISPKVVIKTFIDTFAVFYRDKILRFYDRPLGENKKFFYSIILFAKNYDETEKTNFTKFLSLFYPHYEVILVGNRDFSIAGKNYKFFSVEDEKRDVEKFVRVLNAGIIKGEVVVISYLSCFPDEMFLYNSGRILSIPDVGAIGGYVVLPKEHTYFEEISYHVISSFFLSFNLVYRYKPLNFKKVKELNLNGTFIKKELLDDLTFENKRLEHIIYEMVVKNGKNLYYSPDLFLYQKFPRNFKELFNHIKNNSTFRGKRCRELIKQNPAAIFTLDFFIPIGVLLFLIALFLINRNIFIGLVGGFYIFLFLFKIILSGWKGIKIAILIVISQILYELYFLKGFFSHKK